MIYLLPGHREVNSRTGVGFRYSREVIDKVVSYKVLDSEDCVLA